MEFFNTIVSVLAAIMLFLFSLNGFSKELQTLGSDKLRLWLGHITKNKLSGFLLGVILTAVIQSSSAVTAIAVSLVDAGVITFFNSLSVLIGANLGSTFTAWLVAFKIDNLGSLLLVLGALISMLPFRINLVGKAFFYLGLILFSLQQISIALKPISQNEEVIFWLAQVDNIFMGILVGAAITALVQSSSVTTGLTIILASQGLLSLDASLAIVVGCNIGTTSTALLASASLAKSAKDTALANLIFNFLGMLLFVPFLHPLAKTLIGLPIDITYQIALAHLIFNLSISIVALPLIRPLGNLVLMMTNQKKVTE